MSGRTYTLDADLCDEWVRQSVFGTSSIPIDTPMIDAIRAQQPKPRIPWKQGLRVRNIGSGHVYMLTDEKPRAVIVDAPGTHSGDVGTLIHGIHGVDANDTLDPNMWEVVG